MNLSSMATFVRLQADTDTDDAPDTTLEVYARAAYNQIKATVWPWPLNETSGTFSTTASTAAYAISGLSGAPTMQFVTSVSRSDEVLDYVSPEVFRNLTAEQGSTGTPRVYTIDNGSIKLWPTPSAGSVTYTVTGYRDFADWPSGSDEPDLPRGFDEAICWYMLSRYYQAQEDLELAQMYMRDFEAAVAIQIAAALRGSSLTAGPMIFGGAFNRTLGYSDWVKRGTEG